MNDIEKAKEQWAVLTVMVVVIAFVLLGICIIFQQWSAVLALIMGWFLGFCACVYTGRSKNEVM